jgi:hypothetical protein
MSAIVRKYGWLLTGLIFFAPIYFFLFFAVYPQWHVYSRIAHSGIQTQGVITAKEPMNHAGIRYEYSANGRSYSGSCTTGFGGIPPLDKVNLGQKIPVTYFSGDPSLSLPGDPRDLYYSWTGLLFIWMPLVIGGMAFSAAFALKPRKNTELAQTT